MLKIGKCVVVEHRPIRREAISLRLPFPISVNAMFANSRTGRDATEQYRVWKREGGNMVVQAGRPHLSGPVEITMTFEDKPGRRDLDNLAKGVCDILVSMRVIDGDHSAIVRKLTLAWGTEKGALIRIVPALQAVTERAA